MPTPRIYAALYPEADQSEAMAVAVATAHSRSLNQWLSGEVNSRGICVGWSPMLRWLVERTDMQYRDPVAPTPGPPVPTSGQIWPR